MATRWVFNNILAHGGKNADVSKKMLIKIFPQISGGATMEFFNQYRPINQKMQ